MFAKPKETMVLRKRRLRHRFQVGGVTTPREWQNVCQHNGRDPPKNCQHDCKTVGEAMILRQMCLKHCCEHDRGDPPLERAKKKQGL